MDENAFFPAVSLSRKQMILSCSLRKSEALFRLLTEFRTTTSQEGQREDCRTCQERKSKKPSKTRTDEEDGISVRTPLSFIVVIPAVVDDLYPEGDLRA